MSTSSSKICVGKPYGRWTVKCYAGIKNGYHYWNCECSCIDKTKRAVMANSLLSGRSQSCGCLKKEIQAQLHFKHGHAKKKDGTKNTGTYTSWESMMGRCYNQNRESYENYGGRQPKPITVCERWHDFKNFLEDMGEKPTPNHMIDRYPDGEGNYEPGNCRWATPAESMRHVSSNINLTYNGKTMCLMDWSKEIGVSYSTLRQRIEAGMPVEDILNPVVADKSKYSMHGGRHNLTEIKRIEFRGENLTYTEWSKRTGIPRQDIVRRLKRGMSIEEALTLPVHYRVGPIPKNK